MSQPIYLEFVIFQGATFERTLQFSHGVMLRKPLEMGSSSISVYGLTCALPVGFVLSYPLSGGMSVDLTVASAASIGAETVSIQPYTGNVRLPFKSIAQGPPEDLTGQSWRGQIRPTASSSTVLADLPITLVPVDGLVSIAIPASTTASLAPNAEYAEYSDGSYSGAAYALDIESEVGGAVKKRAYGIARVIREVTRG